MSGWFFCYMSMLLGINACSAPAPTPAPAPPPSLGGWFLGAPNGFDASPHANLQIYKVRPDGTGKTYLTTGPGINLNPSWSYDGRQVSFACNGRTGLSPCIMNADGTGKVSLPVAGTTPVFSPDGLRLVYRTVSPQSEVWIVNSDGMSSKQLTTTTVASNTGIRGSGAASFSPDGKRIIYTSSQSGSNELWTMDPDGMNKKQLTFATDPTAPDANAGRYSPDGKLIVFFHGYESPGTGNVYIMTSAGTDITKLSSCIQTPTGVSANCDGPGWIDDGRIIYQTNRAISSGAVDPQNAVRNWTVNIDGSGDKVLFDPALNYGSRPWTP
jgi:Tol biopolymer transport system component